jgi:excisionase family DNA binding protein
VTEPTPYLTPDEVAEMLRCRPEKIYRLCATKELPSIRFGGRRLISRADLDTYLTTLREVA